MIKRLNQTALGVKGINRINHKIRFFGQQSGQGVSIDKNVFDNNLAVGIDFCHPASGSFGFFHADCRFECQNLTIDIAAVKNVKVNQHQHADSGSSQSLQRITADRPETDNHYPRIFQTFHTVFAEQNLSAHKPLIL